MSPLLFTGERGSIKVGPSHFSKQDIALVNRRWKWSKMAPNLKTILASRSSTHLWWNVRLILFFILNSLVFTEKGTNLMETYNSRTWKTPCFKIEGLDADAFLTTLGYFHLYLLYRSQFYKIIPNSFLSTLTSSPNASSSMWNSWSHFNCAMLNIYIAHENGTYFANPIVYKCVYVDSGCGSTFSYTVE